MIINFLLIHFCTFLISILEFLGLFCHISSDEGQNIPKINKSADMLLCFMLTLGGVVYVSLKIIVSSLKTFLFYHIIEKYLTLMPI